MLESIYQGDFVSKNATTSWEFAENLAENTIQWETARDDFLNSRFASGGMHSVFDMSHIESKIIVL